MALLQTFRASDGLLQIDVMDAAIVEEMASLDFQVLAVQIGKDRWRCAVFLRQDAKRILF